jgi:hypothetical protein
MKDATPTLRLKLFLPEANRGARLLVAEIRRSVGRTGRDRSRECINDELEGPFALPSDILPSRLFGVLALNYFLSRWLI